MAEVRAAIAATVPAEPEHRAELAEAVEKVRAAEMRADAVTVLSRSACHPAKRDHN